MRKTYWILPSVGLLIVTLLSGCGGGSDRAYIKPPIDELILKYTDSKNMSIMLHDMEYDEPSDSYRHQYQVLYEPANNADTLLEELTEWRPVSDEYFDQHIDDMGMVLASKKDGILEKKVAPPGYNTHVGNEKYGRWERRSDGTSFWAFYGQYMFMSHLFGFHSYPVRYSYWNDYRTNYYGRGQAYYGPSVNGNRMYGTRSAYSKGRNGSSKWHGSSNSFKQSVRNKVKRSATRSRTARTSRTSRSSSRYSRGGGTRSRGGRSGK